MLLDMSMGEWVEQRENVSEREGGEREGESACMCERERERERDREMDEERERESACV